MVGQLDRVKAKGIDEAEWQRLYQRHQQEYKRKRLRAIRAAMEHKRLRGLAREQGRSTNTSWLAGSPLTWSGACRAWWRIFTASGPSA